MAGALASLKSLSLKDNRITDAGLGELAGVLQSGALPQLWPSGSPDACSSRPRTTCPCKQGNAASDAALLAVRAVRERGIFLVRSGI